VASIKAIKKVEKRGMTGGKKAKFGKRHRIENILRMKAELGPGFKYERKIGSMGERDPQEGFSE